VQGRLNCDRAGVFAPKATRYSEAMSADIPNPSVAPPDLPLRRNVRLDTLARIRWLAVLGQTGAVIIVHYGLDFTLPIGPSFAVIALSAALNIFVRLRFRTTPRLDAETAAWLLAFDILQLAALLFLTGGLENPFSFLFLGPVLISATALPRRMTLLLGGLAALCATALVFFHLPLPWASDEPLTLPPTYMLAVWLSLLLALGFIGAYAWQVAEEARLLADALAATELVLAREQHLSQLDGLAAAAAHALGTPLSTIAVIAKELARTLGPQSPHAEDIKLLGEQARRCRDILSKLTELSTSSGPFDRLKLSGLIEEVVAPHRHFGVTIEVKLPPDRAAEPVGARNPAVLYGLGNLVENAVDFARLRVDVSAEWSAEEVTFTVADDGPGFPPEVLGRLGEPYVTSRGSGRVAAEPESGGLGLGFFIAKTLIERSGGTLSGLNRPPPQSGAVVKVRWSRADFEKQADITEI